MTREWFETVVFKRMTGPQLRWLFRILVVLTCVDWLMPDVLPFVDELALSWLTYVTWRQMQGRPKGRAD